MPITTGDPDELQLGPGKLYCADIGTTEPTSASAALPSAWREIGWTEEGSAFSTETTVEAINVAEEFDPPKYQPTGRTSSVTFAMAQTVRSNLLLALNAGASEADNGDAVEPPDPGQEVRVMLVWESDDAEPARRWIFRRCLASGALEIARRKAPTKATIPVTFNLEKPAGQTPWKAFPNADGLI